MNMNSTFNDMKYHYEIKKILQSYTECFFFKDNTDWPRIEMGFSVTAKENCNIAKLFAKLFAFLLCSHPIQPAFF